MSEKELFRCRHVDDLAKVNADKFEPEWSKSGFIMRLIEKPEYPYKFSAQSTKNTNDPESWDYMGFGSTGAASIVAALLVERKKIQQENERLKLELSGKTQFYGNIYENSELLEENKQ